jgi:hypothetical protein
MSFIEEVPVSLEFCEFDCRMSTCPPDCPQRNTAASVFFSHEPEAFNFQSRTLETANVSRRRIATTNWVCVILLVLTAIGALYGAGVFDWIWCP